MHPRFLVFLLISIAIHIIILYSAEVFITKKQLTTPANQKTHKKAEKKPMKVFVKFIETEKPPKRQKPQKSHIISQYTMRNLGPKGIQKKSKISGSSPVLKPQIGKKSIVSERKTVKTAKKAKENKTQKASKKTQYLYKVSVFRKNKKTKKNAEKPNRIPLIDPLLISKRSNIIYPQMGPGKSIHISLDTTESKYISYFKHIRDKIYLVWSYPPQARALGIQGSVEVKFIINRDGTLDKAMVVDSSGFRILDEEALKAIKAAAPFPPFPSDWEEKRLVITGRFIYTLF